MLWSLSVLTILLTVGCGKSEHNVVVYCALDREYSEPLLEAYEKKLSIKVLAKYDVESSKTVGLTTAIIAEKQRPRCDLFWNNEILHTLRLKKLGLLETFHPTQSAEFPSQYRDEAGTWYGFAARARILLVNTKLVPESERPNSVDDLVDTKWQGKCGIAKPLFGTTATHAAVIFSQRGDEAGEEFFQKVLTNAKVLSGNKQVAEAVSSGEIAFGLTDTDDAIVEIEKAMPVAIVFPDQADNQVGTLLIPNTLCLVCNAPHAELARKLADEIVSNNTEDALAVAASAQIPLSRESKATPRVLPAIQPRWLKVDFEQAAEKWELVAGKLEQMLLHMKD